MKLVKKVCTYYGAFVLTCKVIDRISPKPAKVVWGWVDKLNALTDERYDRHGNAYVNGRCDTCGSPCDINGCTKNSKHKAAIG